MNGTAWQTPADIIPIGNTKHFLYDDQINPIDTVLEVLDYDEIVKGYFCADSLVNSIVNPDPSYTGPFVDIFLGQYS